jgi:peptide/nickel transport system substrate-binding protein
LLFIKVKAWGDNVRNRKFTGFLIIYILTAWLMMPVKGENNVDINTVIQPKKDFPGIVYAHPQPCRTLDPALARDDGSALLISNIYEGLVKFSEDSTGIEPCLAKSWEISQDGLEWTFFLQRGVLFHDGTPFNARSVKFNVERQLNNDYNMIYAKFVYGPVKAVEVVNAYTVKFILKYPYTPFLNNLAMPFAAPVVSPAAVEKYGADMGKNAVGTGPFKLYNWENNTIKLTRNPTYWGEVPQCEAITFRYVPEEEKRVKLLREGKIDLASHITPEKAQNLKTEGFSTHQTSSLDISYLGLYINKPPFSYHAARKAVNLALDREMLVKQVLKGRGVPASSYLPPRMTGYDSAVEEHDINKAKELINTLSLENKTITIITYSGTRPYNPAGGKILARAIADQLEKIGLQTEITVYEWEEYKQALARQEGNAYLYGWISDNGDPDNFLYPSFASAHIETGLNASHFANQEVDTLLLTAQRTQEPQARRELYQKSLQILENEIPWAALNHSLRIVATAPGLSSFNPHPTGWDRLATVKS